MKNIIKNNIEFKFFYQDINHVNIKLVTYLCNLILKNINNFQAKDEITELGIKISKSAHDIIFTTPVKGTDMVICYCVNNYRKSNNHLVRLYTANNFVVFKEITITKNEKYY